MSTESEIVEMFSRTENPLSVADIAAREGVSKPTIYLILHRHGAPVAARRPRGEPKPPKAEKPALARPARALRDSAGGIARFVSFKSDPRDVIELSADHPAIVEGRTLFPTTVIGAQESPRFLVSGKNNPKTGGMVLKGAWKDMPIFCLTLEERKTCPRSCAQWRGCYGGAMPFARRHDAFDPDFMGALAAEVITMGRAYPKGFVVRLHILGDFFSPEYVLLWAHLLNVVPSLHAFGYTARRVDDPDPYSAKIARCIAEVTRAWSRFAIRTSHTEPGAERAIVVLDDPKIPGVVVCPAQTDATAACSTCALCFAESGRNLTIAFKKHGMTKRRGTT